MFRPLIGCALASGALLAGCATGGSGSAARSDGGASSIFAATGERLWSFGRARHYSCSRAGLQAAVDAYLAAQTEGDPSLMRLADSLSYKEQFAPADMSAGIIQTPLAIDFVNTLLDEEQCETYSEVVVTDPAHPYVLGVHLTVADGAIAEIDAIVTDDDDWLFSAERFLAGVMVENWNDIPEDRRDTRETIIAASDPYFPMFIDISVQPPWHQPCYRQEGAMRTNGTCFLSAPLNVEFGERHWVVDTTKGAAAALVLFGQDLPDSHTFRVVDGKVSNIHTITNCMGDFNCNFDLPENLVAERQARGGLLPPAEGGESES